MKNFRLTLKYDKGKINIKTVAPSIEAAVKIVCIAENCPESAIINIKIS